MACFLVPVAEAIVVTTASVLLEKKQKNATPVASHTEPEENRAQPTFARKLRWLANLLWGGAFLLCFEHVWHGEVVPWFPFLTAAADPVDTMEMLHEMATVGVTMAILVTAVWAVMVAVTAKIAKRADTAGDAV